MRRNAIGQFSRNARKQLPRIRKLLETIRRVEIKPIQRQLVLPLTGKVGR